MRGDSERMLEMSILQFARLTGGSMTLSETPPLAGEHEPIGRVVPVQHNYAAGDVVFVEDENSVCLELLQLHGAMGVVAQRSFAPLASCFSICVPDVRDALQRVAEYCRDRYLGRLIVKVVPSDQAKDVVWQLVRINQEAPINIVKVSVECASHLNWCDADEVLIDGELSDSQRNFAVTYLPTNAPIRLVG